MLPETPDEHQLLLATLPPSKGQIRLALGVVIGLFFAFAVAIPFTNIQLRALTLSFQSLRQQLYSMT